MKLPFISKRKAVLKRLGSLPHGGWRGGGEMRQDTPKCNRCSISLKQIDFVEPDWEGFYRYSIYSRPPLCRPCWVVADTEACNRHYERSQRAKAGVEEP